MADSKQLAMLKRCSREENMTEWNEWRVANPTKDVCLDGANLDYFYLKGVFLNTGKFLDRSGRKLAFTGQVYLDDVSLYRAHLENAFLQRANMRRAILRSYLIGAKLWFAHLEGADLWRAHIEDADFYGACLQGSRFHVAQVNGQTLIAQCKVDSSTDFAGVALSSICIESGLRQLLEYNIRRIGWEKWYADQPRLDWRLRHGPTDEPESPSANGPPSWSRKVKRPIVGLVRLFWWFSDYGLRTWRIILLFFGLAFAFALVYWLWPSSVMVNGTIGDIKGFWHAMYFSVVTMTTLGFGDIAANPDSWGGQTLLMVQVILGYVLLAALVTRFAVLFTAGGPAGKFADDKE